MVKSPFRLSGFRARLPHYCLFSVLASTFKIVPAVMLSGRER
nr:MAG TPA: hypothetical protein [Caudoviricetes sp.]